MPTKKDPLTELMRSIIQPQQKIVETENADACLTTLSFQSASLPDRHVWIDTNLAGQIIIDLEDWTSSEKWDNAVAHFTALNTQTVAAITIAWLEGRTVQECSELGGTMIDMR